MWGSKRPCKYWYWYWYIIDIFFLHYRITDPVSQPYETTNKITDLATSLLAPDIKHSNLHPTSLSLAVLQMAAVERK